MLDGIFGCGAARSPSPVPDVSRPPLELPPPPPQAAKLRERYFELLKPPSQDLAFSVIYALPIPHRVDWGGLGKLARKAREKGDMPLWQHHLQRLREADQPRELVRFLEKSGELTRLVLPARVLQFSSNRRVAPSRSSPL